MVRAAALASCLTCLAGPIAAAETGRCLGTRTGVVAAVDTRLELVLTDGVRLRMLGLEAPGPTPESPNLDESGRDALGAWLDGATISYLPAPEAADRWGRVPAFVYAPPPGSAPGIQAPLAVGAAVLDAGLARFRPEPAPAGCLAGWPALEARARETGLGLWHDSFYAILKIGDHGALAEHAGTNVIVEGRLAAIHTVPARTTLLLEAEGGRVNLTVAARKLKAFTAAGLTASALVGTRLRARGLLDLQFGPHIDLDAPGEVEILGVETTGAVAATRRAD